MGISATCIAIMVAHKSDNLSLIEREGRFGPYVAITDKHGTIEVADNMRESRERVERVKREIERINA